MTKVCFGHQQKFNKLIFISSAQRVVLSKTVGIAKQSNRRNLPTQTVRLYCRRNGANILLVFVNLTYCFCGILSNNFGDNPWH